eukprot:5168917-Ditylum_brightwellii.AAC.2
MKTNHSQQLHEIKEMLSASDTQISNELIKTAVLEVVPEIIQRDMEKQVPASFKKYYLSLIHNNKLLVSNIL